MNKDCCYDMARDIFICHLGMSEVEAEKQVVQMFQKQLNHSLDAANTKAKVALEIAAEKAR